MVGLKRRKWLTFLSVSASGPEFTPILEERGYFTRTRMAADLAYTTADVDYLEAHFKEPNYDSGAEEAHYRLQNPTRENFLKTLHDIGPWLKNFCEDPEWDGGGFMICFAGHGREGDGAIVLEDGVVTPKDLIDALVVIANEESPPGRLRVSAVFDSCHSGAFVTELLDSCFREHSDLLVPWMVFASCMEDEFALEESTLGHGVFTYCFSANPLSPGSLAARSVQPDNVLGPSLAIASGELGCSLITTGAQNPITYFNGAGHLDVCGWSVNLFESGDYIGREEMRTELIRYRDEASEAIRLARPDSVFMGRSTDAQQRSHTRRIIEMLLQD